MPFSQKSVNCYSYQATALGCSASNRSVTMEAGREQVEWLMEVSFVCHCHDTIVAALCKCPLLYCVSSTGFCQKRCCSILGKIIPEAFSCPHFLLCFCFIFSFPWCSCREGQRKFDYCNSCSQSLLVAQLLACKTAALHCWNLRMCSHKLLLHVYPSAPLCKVPKIWK